MNITGFGSLVRGANPDPYQNVTDPQHCPELCLIRIEDSYTTSTIPQKFREKCCSGQHTGPGQCCGSMTFKGGSGSGSAGPCLSIMDPDPAIFVITLPKMPTKNILKKFFCLLLFEGTSTCTCTSFSMIKSQKEVTKQ
jgi:hypothetical protein